MDFLDPKKQRRHALLLYTGYLFIGIAVLISTIVLVYQANGFGVNRDGEVVQNGLIFMSTQPNPADIYLNNKKDDAQTNTRLSLAAGDYSLRLSRAGYRDWNRDISVQGGDVQNYDYPFLFPKNLQTSRADGYQAAPGLATQSRDHRWLVVQQDPASLNFTVYDLDQDEKLEPATFAIPSSIVTPVNGNQAWEVVQWANNNKHFVIKHTYGSGFEYLLVDRTKPQESVNLNKTLKINPGKLTLIDNKYDQYHVLVDGVLSTVRLNNIEPQMLLKGVLEYKSYGTKTVLYATESPTLKDRISVSILVEDRDYTLRQIAKSDSYSLDLASYRGDQYVVLGGSSESIVYVYKNPVEQLRSDDVAIPEALRALRVPGVSRVSFSPTAQFIVAENGTAFGTYDIYLKRAYLYTLQQALDAPQKYAEWMDGNHLTYISGGKQMVFDFDGKNLQTLMAAAPTQGAFFSPDYRFVYSFSTSEVPALTRTGLRTASDL